MPRRNREPPAKSSDIYSTFVVHGNSDSGSDKEKEPSDIYATMVYKNDAVDDGEDEDDASLPPLLKRLPKDFGGGASIDYDNEPEDFGTMIVRTANRSSDRPRGLDYSDFNNSTLKKRLETFDDEDDDNGGDPFSTFVVKSSGKESVSGTMVVRTSGGSGGSSSFKDSTMGRAVASMQAAGEGFGGKHQKKRSSSSSPMGADTGRQQSRISSTSLPDGVNKEDATIKYELISELGLLLTCISILQFIL